MDNKISRMKFLIDNLNNYTILYEKGVSPITDEEWDNRYFELVSLEKETQVIFPNSPTQKIHFENVSELHKTIHDGQPMLSLDKTKDVKEVQSFVSGHDWLGMFKMDGLSCRLTYLNGKLIKGETRGNGIEGEDITHNIRVVSNIPKNIPIIDTGDHKYKINEVVVIDGEIICTYDNFKPFANEYKNPRNFAAGSIRLLDSKELSSRNLSFVAWDLVSGIEEDFFMWRLEKLDDWGFETVPRVGDAETISDAIEALDNIKANTNYPIDGYVFKFESVEYGKSLGRTDHHWRNAIAYKFYDDEYETELLDIEWGMGRTDALTPVAVFKPIEIDGTVVEKASLHNYSVMIETLGKEPYLHQPVWVIKSNQIIPQIAKAEKCDTPSDHSIGSYPLTCPVCGEPTQLVTSDAGVVNVCCVNPDCQGKIVNRIDHYVGKKGLDIKGLSEKTIEKLIDWEWIYDIKDIYLLKNYKQTWMNKPGFGEASVEKILTAIEDSKNCTLDHFIAALGIQEIGSKASKDIADKFKTWENFRKATAAELLSINGIGEVMAGCVLNFDYTDADYIYEKFIHIKEEKAAIGKNLKGKVFVVTGKVHIYKNRDELSAKITSLGGEVKSSVSSKTNYLINNDINSTSSKNVKAKDLGIPIITEEQFEQMIS